MAVEIATAYVSLVPSLRGAQSAIEAQMVPAAAVAGTTAGTAMGTGMAGAALKALGPLALVATAVGAISSAFNFAGDSVRSASALQESVNALSVVYGENAAALNKIAEAADHTRGLSQTAFNAVAVQFSSFAKTVAGEGGDVVSRIDEITGRAADFASVMDVSLDEAVRLFQSGLAGETEPLRRYGKDLSAATVEAYALSHGLAATKAEITEAIKVQARWGVLMEQTSNTQGDFVRTSESLANRQRTLAGQWENLKATLGQALLPLVERFVGWLSRTVDAISDVAQGMGQADGPMSGFVAFLRTTGEIIGTVVWPVLKALGDYIRVFVMPILAAMGQAFNEIILPSLQHWAEVLKAELMPVLRDWGERFKTDILPRLEAAAKIIIEKVIPAVAMYIAISLEMGAKVLPILIRIVDFFFVDIPNALAAAQAAMTKFKAPIDAALGSALSLIAALREIAALNGAPVKSFTPGAGTIGAKSSYGAAVSQSSVNFTITESSSPSATASAIAQVLSFQAA